MNLLERIRQRAAADPHHIVLPEGEDPGRSSPRPPARVIVWRRLPCSVMKKDSRRGTPTMVISAAVKLSNPSRQLISKKGGVFIMSLERSKGLMPDEARIAIEDPLYYGNVAGASRPARMARWRERPTPPAHNRARGAPLIGVARGL